MAGLGFKKRFIQPIWDETKIGTIRAKRKRPIKVGEMLFLYTAMRTKHCQKIGERRALATRPIRLFPAPADGKEARIIIGSNIDGTPFGYAPFDYKVVIEISDPQELDRFAICDGFDSWEDMRAFWMMDRKPKKGEPPPEPEWFEGDWILWKHFDDALAWILKGERCAA